MLKRDNVYRTSWILLVLAVLVYAIALSSLTSNDSFINSYPFITDDGFDWLFQGESLAARLQGTNVATIPMLRDPVFVTVTALDALVGGRGFVVMFALSVSLFASHAFLVLLTERFNVGALVSAMLLLVSIISPLSDFRLFVLADPLAIAFMAGSVFFIVRHLLEGGNRWPVLAGLCAILGALTQTYAVIPFIIGMVVSTLGKSDTGKEQVGKIYLTLAVCGVIILLKVCWALSIAHEDRPATFALLKPSLEMWRFYLNVWTVVYVPLLPLVVVGLVYWKGRGFPNGNVVAFLTITVITFAGLSFCYQWPEARFTFNYYIIVMMLLVVLFGRMESSPRRALNTQVSVASSIPLAVGIFLLPSNPWQPALNTLDFAPERSWLLEAYQAQPNDRLLKPGADICTLPAAESPYRQRIFEEYIRLKQSEIE
jgi:hypothetical protein